MICTVYNSINLLEVCYYSWDKLILYCEVANMIEIRNQCLKLDFDVSYRYLYMKASQNGELFHFEIYMFSDLSFCFSGNLFAKFIP